MLDQKKTYLERIENLKQLLSLGLPGEHSHLKAIPIARLNKEKIKESLPLAKQSAVLLLLYPHKEETMLTFIKRASYNGTHSGQISFPGGKVELNDKDLYHTALRETHEEIGVCSEKIELIGPMSWVYIPPSNFQVHPFLAFSRVPLQFKPDPKEVAGVLTYSIHDLMKKDVFSVKKIKTGTIKASTPGYTIAGETIWGASAMMLTELLDVLNRPLNRF